MTTTKTCTVCGKEKPASDYRLHSDKKTVMRYCNDCHLAKRRASSAPKADRTRPRARHRASRSHSSRRRITTASTTTSPFSGRHATR